MAQPETPAISDAELSDILSEFYADPYGHVLFCYDWGHGDLKGFDGPDDWQREYLEQLGEEVRKRRFDGVNTVPPIRFTTASGHGSGKTALSSWLILWILSTRPNSKGVVTANTAAQLETKTWAELAKWNSRAIFGHWFEIAGTKIYHRDHPKTWRADGITCREENSEAFAGLHAADSTPFYLFDEASAIPEAIWNVAEGGLTDGEPQFHAFGNPTRRDGRFYENTFGRLRHRWIKRSIDSRKCRFPNKKLIEEWEQDYGEDSDFFRVRVRGLPPRASDLQFIDADTIRKAQKENIADASPSDPLIAGIDIARGGSDNNVIRFRRGLDARSIPPIRIPGADTRDSMRMIAVITNAIQKYRPDAVMVDGTGVGGPIIDRLQQLGYDVYEVQFGGKSPDRHYANMRAYMWGRMRDWLRLGAIEDDPQLEIDLQAPQYGHDKQDRLLLESKEAMKRRGVASPDDADALALTFAYDVEKKSSLVRNQQAMSQESDYDPLENI